MGHFRFAILAMLFLCLGRPGVADEQEDAPAREVILRWVAELDNEDFATRQAASAQLRRIGRRAFGPLCKAAASPGAEASQRAMSILCDACLSKDATVVRAAKETLRTLVDANNRAAAIQARTMLVKDLEPVLTLFERGGVTIHRGEGGISGLQFQDGKIVDALLLFKHSPDLEFIQRKDPAFAEMMGKITEMNLFMSKTSDEELKLFKHFPNLTSVPMGYTKVTDAGLVHLKDLKNLEYVGLRGNQVTDAGLVHLKDLTNLTGLYLGETRVTDDGLVHLKRMTKMERLILNKTAITDRGLEHLYGMTALKSLNLGATRVTSEGIARLRERIKGVSIEMAE